MPLPKKNMSPIQAMRVNKSLFSLLLALPLIAAGCGGSVTGSGSDNGSNSTGANGFTVVSVSVAQSQIWQINRAIDIRFTRAVDFSTVGLNTISIATPSGLSATGSFSQVDADTVRFQPACPTLADNSDAGFLPGGRTYTLHVLDTALNGVTVRDTQGYGVYQGLVVTFQTPNSTDPQALFLDTVPGPPDVRVRNRGAVSATDMDATYLERGDGTREYFYQQLSTQQGELIPPGGSQYLPRLNKYSDIDSQWSLVVFFNQPIISSPENISSDLLALEYEQQDGVGDFTGVGTQVELIANCTTTGAAVRVTPLGVVPQGKQMRLNIRQGFSDLTGDGLPSDNVGAARMQTFIAANAFDREYDEVTEDFDYPAGIANSREDGETALPQPPAAWEDGLLRASFDFGGTGGPGGDFDWVVGFSGPETVILDTVSSQILGGPGGIPTFTQTVINGIVDVRDFRIKSGSTVVVLGPNPLTILASGEVVIEGSLSVSGSDNPGVQTLNTTNQPEAGATGNGGGGRGGTGSFLTSQSTPKGGDGFGAFAISNRGGTGGETTYRTGGTNNRRGSGGGGGTFGPNTVYDHDRLPNGTLTPDTPLVRAQIVVGLDAEQGFGGGPNGKGAISQSVRAVGGAIGVRPWVDGDDDNEFMGQMITADGTLVVGELSQVFAGAGGGAGGDAVSSNSFPLQPFQLTGDEKGSGGGGGGGGLRILALESITIKASGRVFADGGEGGGGENTNFFDRVGGGSGGGSGGHVIFSAAQGVIIEGVAINSEEWYFDAPNSFGGVGWPNFSSDRALSAVGGQGGAGAQDFGGSGANGGTAWRCDCISRQYVDLDPPGCNAAFDTDVPPHRCIGCFSIAASSFNDPMGPVLGAGGDGGPGIIQLHVGDPATDIQLPDVGQAGREYGIGDIVNGVLTVAPLDPTQVMAPPPTGWLHPQQVADRVAGLVANDPNLNLASVRMSDDLVPFFGDKSMARSTWIPLGLARVSPSGIAAGFLPIQGVEVGNPDDVDNGFVEHTAIGDGVLALPPIIDALAVDSTGGQVAPYITDGGSTLVFDAVGMPDLYRVTPSMARRFSVVLGDAAVTPSSTLDFEVVSVTYDQVNDQLRCTTAAGVDMTTFSATTVFASLRPHHFRVETAGVLDNLTSADKIRFGFDATTADVAGNPSASGAYTVTSVANQLARDITDMNGNDWDFFRFEVEFDLDDPLNTPLPGLLFMKFPYEFGAN